MIWGSNEQLQHELEYTLLKPDSHSWWVSKMQSECEDTLEERYTIKFRFKLGKKYHRNVWNASDCFSAIFHAAAFKRVVCPQLRRTLVNKLPYQKYRHVKKTNTKTIRTCIKVVAPNNFRHFLYIWSHNLKLKNNNVKKKRFYPALNYGVLIQVIKSHSFKISIIPIFTQGNSNVKQTIIYLFDIPSLIFSFFNIFCHQS